MSKKIVGEDGKTYVQKKPFYKRVWFWLIVIIIVIVAASSMGGGNNKATKVSSTTKSKSATENVSKETFKVGDTIKADGVTLKVNKVEYNDGSSISQPDSGKSYVIVNVTITNVNKSKASYNPLDFKIDDKGNQTDLTEIVMDDNGNNIVNDELKYGDLSKGATVTGTLVGQAVKADKLQLLYTGSLFSNESKITVDLN
ncbi:DUF4352 domain-containing protein [Leuconostoc gasicomitatum]|uniref:DUF4352 domain-containing protein n=1 Tax=Leuconostoc gasicomitatum TaxID=115778 RepID=UPI001CC3EC30|nr:DUF4352 domain-containing protein [Leuconostoc gasicomitatum]MBZ5969017.1 DUF4352 domain-containing protein [Leuconostoc gasicomitatum]MBZ5998499.1 DUF4352 domain-containing protein [Leuconostoc gasicomitatum]